MVYAHKEMLEERIYVQKHSVELNILETKYASSPPLTTGIFTQHN